MDISRRGVLKGIGAGFIAANISPFLEFNIAAHAEEKYLRVPFSEYDFKKHVLPNGFSIYLNPTQNYVTTSAHLEIAGMRTPEGNAGNFLLSNVLGQGPSTHPSLEKMVRRLKELYSANLSSNTRSSGQNSYFSVDVSSITNPVDTYNQLEGALELFGEYLLNPSLEKGVFRPQVVEREKRSASIALARELRKRDDIWREFVNWAFPGNKVTINSNGTPKHVMDYNPQKLFTHYQGLLNPKDMHLYVSGGIKEENLLKFCERTYGHLQPKEPVTLDQKFSLDRNGPRTMKKKVGIPNQKLLIMYPYTKNEGEHTALSLFADILGGSNYSRLYQVVREQQGLTYTIFSYPIENMNYLIVRAAIKEAHYDKAIHHINEELDKMLAGGYTEQEVSRSKRGFANNIAQALDKPSSRMNWEKGRQLWGRMGVEDHLKMLDGITKKDVQKSASRIDKSKALTFYLY